MANEVITGALAIVRVNGQPVGYMRGIRVTENFQRAEVRGLGNLIPVEVPVLSWAGTMNCDFFNIWFQTSQIPGAIIRTTSTLQEWVNTVLLNDVGVTVDIFRNVASAIDPVTGIISASEEAYAQIQQLFLDSEGFDINEGQISGRNQTFRYIKPIRFNP